MYTHMYTWEIIIKIKIINISIIFSVFLIILLKICFSLSLLPRTTANLLSVKIVAFYKILYKYNHTGCTLKDGSGLFLINKITLIFIHIFNAYSLFLFILLEEYFIYGHTTIYLSIHLWWTIVVSIFGKHRCYVFLSMNIYGNICLNFSWVNI